MTGSTMPGLLAPRPAPPGVEVRVARLLSAGTRVAVGLLAIGSLLLVASGRSPLEAGWLPLDPGALVADLTALRPEGFLWLGLVASIATPLLRVAVASAAFARAGERWLAMLGAAVLLVIAVAVIAGTRAL